MELTYNGGQDISLSPVSGLGPEIVDFGGSEWLPPTAKPIGKGGGRSPPLFPAGFALEWGHVSPQNRRSGRRPEIRDEDRS